MSQYYYNQNPYYQNAAQQYASGTSNMAASPVSSWTHGWFAYNDPSYVKGLIVGAGVTFLLTNPKVQRALVKGAVSLWSTVQGGVEEVKEQILDIKSEMSMQGDEK